MPSKNFCLTAITTLIIYGIVLFFYYEKSQESAINSAKVQTEDFLRNSAAARKFFKQDQKVRVEEAKQSGKLDKDVFLPEFYSCTYATIKINDYYNKMRKEEKLSAIKISFVAQNPRNPLNAGDQDEIKLLKLFNQNVLKSFSQVVEKSNKKYLYYAKPTNKLDNDCLLCHGTVADAPNAIIKKYGDVQGFNHKKGEIRAFIKVLMPLEKYIKEAQELFLTISISTLIILISIFIMVRLFLNRTKREASKFKIVTDSLDELIIVKDDYKVHSINKAFLHFFDVKSPEEFKRKHTCVSDLFNKREGYLDIDFNDKGEHIIKLVESVAPTKRIVEMENFAGIKHTFSIRIDRLEESEHLYVIVLSNITQLQGKTEALEKKANIDNPTGVMNRQRFEELYHMEFSRSLRYFNHLTLIFIDIDHFKKINDNFGHDVGDDTLIKFARVLNENIREYDILARWGGEEFILMLPQTEINAGYKLAEKLRKVVKETTFEKIGKLTCSIGISMLRKGDEPKALTKRADIAVYKAKNAGRDRIIMEI